MQLFSWGLSVSVEAGTAKPPSNGGAKPPPSTSRSKPAQSVIPTVRNVYESKEKQLTKGPSQEKVRQLEEAKEKAKAQQREKKGGHVAAKEQAAAQGGSVKG
jgi:hypothetical protein